MIGDPEDVHRSTLQLDDEEHVELGEVHSVEVKKSVARMPLASVARNCRQDGDCGEQDRDRVGKGAPDRARQTRMPRPRSSPWMRTKPQRRFSRAIRTMSSTSSSTWAADQGHAWIASAAICASRALGANKGASLA